MSILSTRLLVGLRRLFVSFFLVIGFGQAAIAQSVLINEVDADQASTALVLL